MKANRTIGILLLLISTYSYGYEIMPSVKHTPVTVTTIYGDPTTIANICLEVVSYPPKEGNVHGGCATLIKIKISGAMRHYCTIWAPHPRGWEDAKRNQTLGHELRHCLGEKHN